MNAAKVSKQNSLELIQRQSNLEKMDKKLKELNKKRLQRTTMRMV
jgi:hypothetical protein